MPSIETPPASHSTPSNPTITAAASEEKTSRSGRVLKPKKFEDENGDDKASQVFLQLFCLYQSHWGKNPRFIQKFTCSKSHNLRNSHFRNRIFSKIHTFKITFFTKIAFSKSQFSQKSYFQIAIFTKIIFSKSQFSQKSHFQTRNFHKNHIFKIAIFTKITIWKSQFFKNITI